MYKYTYFQSDLDGERFISDLRHNVSRLVVFDAIMRVRTSTGVRSTGRALILILILILVLILLLILLLLSFACRLKRLRTEATSLPVE